MNIATFAGHTPVRFPEHTAELVMSNCFLGIEVELEGVSSGRVANGMYQWWRSESDGTLRNEGREFVFREPFAGQDAVNGINSLYDNWRSEWIISERGSMHVHVDIRDMNADQYLVFRIYMLALDDYLFSFSPERYSSPFCRASSRSSVSINALRHMLRLDVNNWEREVIFLRNNRRYLSTNVHAGIRFGSIEFRHFQVPDTKEDMLTIVNTLLTIKKAAMSAAPNDVERHLKSAVLSMDHSQIIEAFPDAIESINRHLKLVEAL